jgi:hypothetical protein
MNQLKEICGCCGEDMPKTIYVEDTMGPVCEDCAEGIISGFHYLLQAGIQGVTNKKER